jgi:hypothetical protein
MVVIAACALLFDVCLFVIGRWSAMDLQPRRLRSSTIRTDRRRTGQATSCRAPCGTAIWS